METMKAPLRVASASGSLGPVLQVVTTGTVVDAHGVEHRFQVQEARGGGYRGYIATNIVGFARVTPEDALDSVLDTLSRIERTCCITCGHRVVNDLRAHEVDAFGKVDFGHVRCWNRVACEQRAGERELRRGRADLAGVFADLAGGVQGAA